jgi:hypothetical protein
MPYPLDPDHLEGDDLERWYRRSPREIEAERQAAAARRHTDFFGSLRSADPDPASARSPVTPPVDPDPGLDRDPEVSGLDIDPGFSVTQIGPNQWRAARADSPETPNVGYLDNLQSAGDPALDTRLAGPEDQGELIEIGNPHNPRLRREWERANGKPWPKTDDGRRHHVSHKTAIADGGTNTLDNIEPMHPDEHIALHIKNGDFARWGARGGRPRPSGFGGIEALGVAGDLFTGVVGLLTGRVRTDTPLHAWFDMAGAKSMQEEAEDKERARREIQRQLFPDCPPNTRCV